MAATYTVKQVAQILGYSTNSIYTFLKEKRIKGIRMGKGRFRIPQSELDRLLMTQKGVSTVPTAQAVEALRSQLLEPITLPASPNGVVEPIHSGVMSTIYPAAFQAPRVEVPSLLDWFVGIGSIVLGLAMFLFSRTYEEYAIEQFVLWVPAIRVLLIAGGFGLLLSDVVGRKFSVWHRMFHGSLILAFGGYAFVLASMFDFEGMIIFGVLTGILLVTFFVAIGGIAGFASYVGLMIALLPVAAVISPTTSSLVQLVSSVPVPMTMLIAGWFIVVILFSVVVVVGYQRDRRVFWFGMLGVSVMLTVLAIHYAELLLWGRALFVLITALMAVFVPVWQSLTFSHKRDRAFVFTAFGSLLVVYIIVVGVLRVIQTNIMDYATRELENKSAFGKMLIESTILSTKTILSSSAQNPLLISAIEHKDDVSLLGVQKAIFEGNTSIHQVFIAGVTGEVLSVYPYTNTTITPFGSTDFFIKAVTTKQVITSGYTESTTNNVRKESLIIVAPIIGVKKTVIGVIMGTLDLSGLGNKLQEVASSGRGEYFVVVDSVGKQVIHPDNALVGIAASADDLVLRGIQGVRGSGEGYTSDGIRSLVSYDSINGNTGWAIAVKVPVAQVLKETNAGGITVLAVIIVSVVMVSMFLVSHRARPVIIEAASVEEPQSSKKSVAAASVLHTLAGRKKGKRAYINRKDTS